LPFPAGIVLWLESHAGLLVVGVKTLRQTSAGYREQMEKVRYRLVPFIW
jgi:hypothetical protein